MTTGNRSPRTRGISDCLVCYALLIACSRDAEVDVAPSAEEPTPENDAKLRLDDEEHAIKSAIRVRRGELTEEWMVSSDEAGCELARDKVAGKSQPRLRLAWTMATDFETGKLRAINPWWLFVNARGGAGHGSIDGATMTMEVPAHDKRRAKLILPPTRWERYTVSAAGFVTFRECSSAGNRTRPIDTLSVEIGKVRVAIRSVNLLLNDRGTRTLLFSTTDRACNDFEEGELLLMTSALGEEPLNLTLIGRALPYRHGNLPLQGNGALQIRHKDIAAGDTHLEVSVSGKAKLESKGGHEKDLAVSVDGRASARICRMTAAK